MWTQYSMRLIFLSYRYKLQLKSFFAADEATPVSLFMKKNSRGYFLLVFVATWLKTDIISKTGKSQKQMFRMLLKSLPEFFFFFRNLNDHFIVGCSFSSLIRRFIFDHYAMYHWSSISSRWRYWSRMIVSCGFYGTNRFTFHPRKCCNLTLSLYLINCMKDAKNKYLAKAGKFGQLE